MYVIAGHPGNLNVRKRENIADGQNSPTGSSVSITDCHLVALLSSLPVLKTRLSSKRFSRTSNNAPSPPQPLPILSGHRPRQLPGTDSDFSYADRTDAAPLGAPPIVRSCRTNEISCQPLLSTPQPAPARPNEASHAH